MCTYLRAIIKKTRLAQGDLFMVDSINDTLIGYSFVGDDVNEKLFRHKAIYLHVIL